MSATGCYEALAKNGTMRTNVRSDVIEHFRRHDVDKSGKIERTSLTQVLQALRKSLPYLEEQDVETLLAFADRRGDGKLDYTAFLSWVFGGAPCTQAAGDVRVMNGGPSTPVASMATMPTSPDTPPCGSTATTSSTACSPPSQGTRHAAREVQEAMEEEACSLRDLRKRDRLSVLRGRLQARDLGVQTVTTDELWKLWHDAVDVPPEFASARDSIRKYEEAEQCYDSACCCPSSSSTAPGKMKLEPGERNSRFRERLAANTTALPTCPPGVQGASADCVPGMPNTCDEIRKGLDMEMCGLEDDGVGNIEMDAVELVRIYLSVEVAGETRYLIESDRFDLPSGDNRELMQPLQRQLRHGETWQEALETAFEHQVGLSKDFQRRYLQINEQKYEFSEREELLPEYPPSEAKIHLHEVYAEVVFVDCDGWTIELDSGSFQRSGSAGTQYSIDRCDVSYDDGPALFAALDPLGLPDGNSFVVREVLPNGTGCLHVWCWKSRDYGHVGDLQIFAQYLETRGVDTSKFGVSPYRNLFQLYTEFAELKESSLVEVFPQSGADELQLVRHVEALNIRLVVELHGSEHVLTSYELDWVDDGVKVRGKASQLLVAKVREGELWRDALKRTFFERFGVEEETQECCFEVEDEDELEDDVEEIVRQSQRYPMTTQYKIRTLTVRVTEPDNMELDDIGLPRGNAFVAQGGNLGLRQGRLQVWAWKAAGASGGENVVLSCTSYERLCWDLDDAENLVRQMAEDPRVGRVGLAAPVQHTLMKIRSCIEKVVDIDALMAGIEEGAMVHKAGNSNQDVAILSEFIHSNFTRTKPSASGKKTERRMSEDRRKSFDHSLFLFAQKGESKDGTLEVRCTSIEPSRFAAPDWRQGIIDGQDNWGYDVLALDELTDNRVIQSYGEVALAPVQKALTWDSEKLMEFLERTASLYYQNPYHSAAHAVQVCHATRWLVRAVGLLEHMRSMEIAALLIAAICHDVKHFGRNNAFCIASQHELALLYNDRSVLENMHAATCFTILQGMCGSLSKKDQAEMRTQIVEYILSTDMSEHFEFISKLKMRQESVEFTASNEPDRRLVARLCLKAGDICHAALPWALHQQWSIRVQQEFIEQGDEERRLGLPVSALCDRASLSEYGKSQRGFLEFVCLPVFEVLPNMREPKQKPEPELPVPAPDPMRRQRSTGTPKVQRLKTKWRTTKFNSRQLFDTVQVVCSHQIRVNASKWVEDTVSVEKSVSILKRMGSVASNMASNEGDNVTETVCHVSQDCMLKQ